MAGLPVFACGFCGVTWAPEKGDKRRKWCSLQCRRAGNHLREHPRRFFTCGFCGVASEKGRSSSRRWWCSLQCRRAGDRLRDRAWHAANRDSLNARARARAKANPDLVKAKKWAWNKANPDRVAAMKRRDYAKHRDANLEKAKIWKRNNRQKVRDWNRKWVAEHPQEYRALVDKHRAARRRRRHEDPSAAYAEKDDRRFAKRYGLSLSSFPLDLREMRQALRLLRAALK